MIERAAGAGHDARRAPSLEELDALWSASWPRGLPRGVEFPFGRRPISACLREWARIQPGRTAVNFYGARLDYAELDGLSEGFAHLLLANGVAPGDRVAVMLQNSLQLHIAFHGILKAGAVYVPVSPMSRIFELNHQLTDSGARVILAQDDLMPLVREVRKTGLVDFVYVTCVGETLPPDPVPTPPRSVARRRIACLDAIDLLPALATAPRDPLPEPPLSALAALNYTGGTTGLPKGCMHSHWNQLYTAATARFRSFAEPGEEVVVNMIPEFWVAGGNVGLLGPAVNGSTVVLLSGWSVEAALQAVALHRGTQLTLSVELAEEAAARPDFRDFDLGSLRTLRVISLAHRLTPALRRRWQDLAGVTPVEVSYGLTESHTGDTFTIGMQEDDFDLREGSVFMGLPVPGTRIRICDFGTGAPLPLGEEGEICIQSPSATLGYWKKREATAELIRDGWIRTGDRGTLGPGGHLHYLGRRKAMLKVNGLNVFPAELEAVLALHPAVASVAVVAREDRRTGQRPVAFVTLAAPVAAEALRDFCRRSLSEFKLPEVRVLEAMPLTRSGKISLFDLAALAEAGDGGG